MEQDREGSGEVSDVDGRARLAAGGIAAVAVSVAVVSGVALSNSAALADTAGAPVGLQAVVVPSSSVTPAPVPAPTGATAPDAAQVVPAPDPQTVVEQAPAPAPVETEQAAPAPAPAPQPAAPAASPQEQQAIADDACASGRWDRAEGWARSHGWSSKDTEAWIAQLKERRAAQTPASAGSPSGGDSWSHDGSKRDRSHDSPDRRD
jgi:hypothetical protein